MPVMPKTKLIYMKAFALSFRFFMFFSVSLLTFVLIAVLVVSEIRYYSVSQLKYEYDVDPDFDG